MQIFAFVNWSWSAIRLLDLIRCSHSSSQSSGIFFFRDLIYVKDTGNAKNLLKKAYPFSVETSVQTEVFFCILIVEYRQ